VSNRCGCRACRTAREPTVKLTAVRPVRVGGVVRKRRVLPISMSVSVAVKVHERAFARLRTPASRTLPQLRLSSRTGHARRPTSGAAIDRSAQHRPSDDKSWRAGCSRSAALPENLAVSLHQHLAVDRPNRVPHSRLGVLIRGLLLVSSPQFLIPRCEGFSSGRRTAERLVPPGGQVVVPVDDTKPPGLPERAAASTASTV
jgi:hypothetical protein